MSTETLSMQKPWQIEHKAKVKQIEAYLNSIGLQHNIVFIPQSRSRNAGKEPCINWSVCLWKSNNDKNKMLTDYQQGVGHLPKWNSPVKNEYDTKLKYSCMLRAIETGKVHRIVNDTPVPTNTKLTPPSVVDVIYSLIMDSDVLDYAGFELWANNLGFDTDSRKAETIYNICINNTLKLKSILGQEALDKLKDLYQDY